MAKRKRCNEQEASPCAVNLTEFLPVLIGLPMFSCDGYCKDCGSGITFMGLLAMVVALGVSFVVAIAHW